MIHFRGKILAFAIRHASWNVGNFKIALSNDRGKRPQYRGRYLLLFTAIPTAATWTGFVHELCL